MNIYSAKPETIHHCDEMEVMGKGLVLNSAGVAKVDTHVTGHGGRHMLTANGPASTLLVEITCCPFCGECLRVNT